MGNLVQMIAAAAGREKADQVIRNVRIVDVFSHEIVEGSIGIKDGRILGIGDYDADTVIDGHGRYAIPGLIDSHIHIESAYVSPEEIGRLLTVCGTTTIVADPHEIVNVAGLEGLEYMLKAGERSALDIRFMLPSCVPATPFENSGATVDAKAMEAPMRAGKVLGLGEFMDFVGVVNATPEVVAKLELANELGMPVDGHSPGLDGMALNAYALTGICTDHECSTYEEALDRVRCGMYVLMRQGSACHDIDNLLPAVNTYNSRRFLLCSDDRQPKTIFEQGHLQEHLKKVCQAGIDPITAIQMGTINAAECYGLKDIGAIAPGRRANITLLDDLVHFEAKQVFIDGKCVAEEGRFLCSIDPYPIDSVRGRFNVANFSAERLKLPLKTGRAHVIDIQEGGIVTKKAIVDVKCDAEGNFVFDPSLDVAKVSVIERHHGTGNVSVGLIGNYGIKEGAIAVSVAHDSHNIICVGVSDQEMACAVEALIAQEGGIVLVKNGKVIASMALPIGGLMSDRSGEWVAEQLDALHDMAHEQLKINPSIEPVMVLCFMSLPVIPEVKITDCGLFDVTTFEFLPIDAE